MGVIDSMMGQLMGVVEGTVVLDTHKTTVLCPLKSRDIARALSHVPNGAELIETYIGDGRVKLVFELPGQRLEC